MEEDIRFRFNSKKFKTGLLILITLLLIFNTFMMLRTTNGRLDRLEFMLNFNEYANNGYMMYGVNENSSIKNIRDLYADDTYKGLKMTMATTAISYLCDGTGEGAIKYIAGITE